MPIPEAGVSPALRKLLRVAARHDVAVPIAGPNGLLRLAPAPDHRRERRRLINPRRPGGTGLCGARPCRARRGLRRASSCRLASIPPPIPVAARPAAISPGLARRRPYSSTTAGHTRSSINSETGSASSHPGPGTTAGRKATYTRLSRGSDQRHRCEVPVSATGGPARRSRRQPAGAVMGQPQRVGFLDAGSLREHHHHAAGEDREAVSTASWSASPRRTETLRGAETATPAGP